MTEEHRERLTQILATVNLSSSGLRLIFIRTAKLDDSLYRYNRGTQREINTNTGYSET